MVQVFKYPIHPGRFTVTMPDNARILTVQTQRGDPMMWALVDERQPKVERTFHAAGTGHEIDEDPELLKYVNTFQLSGGAMVFHLFEII